VKTSSVPIIKCIWSENQSLGCIACLGRISAFVTGKKIFMGPPPNNHLKYGAFQEFACLVCLNGNIQSYLFTPIGPGDKLGQKNTFTPKLLYFLSFFSLSSNPPIALITRRLYYS
jgi:hypothetical protein